MAANVVASVFHRWRAFLVAVCLAAIAVLLAVNCGMLFLAWSIGLWAALSYVGHLVGHWKAGVRHAHAIREAAALARTALAH